MNFTELAQISGGFAQSRILQTAVKLGIFDIIKTEGSAPDEVSEALNTNIRAMEILLNALAALKVLDKKNGKFYNTPASLTYLIKTSPKYFGNMIFFEEAQWDIWGKLEETVRTGKPARNPDMFQEREPDTEEFIMAMDSIVKARGDAEVLGYILDLSNVQTLIDIGSGPGTYPIHFLEKHSHLQITIFDLPGTLKVTRKILEREDMLGRINILEGDYNTDDIPKGFDIAFLSNIIHSENEETNAKLMKKLYEALNHGGKLIIKDHILDETLTSPAVGAIFSIQMLLSTKGRDYSFKEIRLWLKDAGFNIVEHVKLPPPLTSSLAIGIK